MTEIVRGDGMKYALTYNQFHNLESIGIEGKDEALIKYTYRECRKSEVEDDRNDGNTQVLYFKNATAFFCSFTKPEEKVEF